MIRVLKESLSKSVPSWIRDFLDKSKNKYADTFRRNLTSFFDIDLQNCEYTELPNLTSRDPIWRDPSVVLFFLINSDIYVHAINSAGAEQAFVYDTYSQFSSDYTGSKKYLINNSTHRGFIKVSTKEFHRKYREDPRQGGQYRDSSGKWITPDGRDKSGYKIPDISNLVKRLDNMNLDNYAKVLERYHKRIDNFKSRIFSMDFTKDPDLFDDILDCLGQAVRSYSGLVKEIEQSDNIEDTLDYQVNSSGTAYSHLHKAYSDLYKYVNRFEKGIKKD